MNPNQSTAPLLIAWASVRYNFCLLPSVRYFSILMDRWLTWLPHITGKTHILNDRFRLIRPLLSSRHMELPTKLMIYKLLPRSIWTYGNQLWGAAKTSNISLIQSFQYKDLCIISKIPFYVSNHTSLVILNYHVSQM